MNSAGELTTQQFQATNPLLTSPVAWWEDDTVIKRLAGSIFLRAVKDAQGLDIPIYGEPRDMVQLKAQEWLASEEAELIIEGAGYDPEKVRSWVRAGCPGPERKRQGRRK